MVKCVCLCEVETAKIAKIATRHRVFRFSEAKCLTGEEAGKSGCLKTRLVKLKKNSESTAIE